MIKLLMKILLMMLFIALISCNDVKDNSNDRQTQNEEQSLRASVNRFPDSLLLKEDLIEHYRNKGNYDSALSITNEALLHDNQNVELWDIRGVLNYENGDTLNAIKAYETLIDIYPLPEYLISLGTMYAQTKNPKALIIADALVVANQAKAQREAYFIKGLYFNYLNNQQTAIRYFDSSIAMDYNYMFAYREKAIALYGLSKFEDALKVLQRAVTVQNNFDEGYYWMGKVYEKLDSTQKAVENYQMALLYDKNFIEAKEALQRLNPGKQ
ncbi:MAG: tetratricopeptide repeat protein [Ginsengibacter sp.]